MNLPNRITLSRLGLAAVLFLLMALMEHEVIHSLGTWGWVVYVLFIVATGTDWLDGFVARKYGLVSPLGRILDPFVDKVVICGTYVFLTGLFPKFVPAWFTVAILAREFFVNALRGYLESRGIDFSARGSGKLKMILQSVSIGCVLFMMGTAHYGLFASPSPLSGGFVVQTTSILLVLALVSTLWSGWQYLQIGMRSLKEDRP
ncbi:MAG TPA: CDP-diacylglycerol--glycerol-3-phosphate 3-phosphatidyltransferase [Planctomycetota bacterium]|nr:CDP-diacylglycerol--glycerol-3-phosphate 3-phosphatidyltransferase [Planctomycetota bacterium]